MARVVVVGGGLGGLAAAARLAKLGHEVSLLERRDRLGGALGTEERDGFRWDTGPTWTALPAVLRDLFRKSGRPLERVLDLVPVQPLREHRFADGTVLALPAGGRGAQYDAVEDALGPGAGKRWVAYTDSFEETWAVLRRGYLEHPYRPEHADRETRAVLAGRTSLRRLVRRSLRDERLRQVALTPVLLDGQRPRDVPAWVGVLCYVEQCFGAWTIPGGLGLLADALTRRLAERRVTVRLGTTARDLVLRDGRPVGVATDEGAVPADLVVCAVDPRRLPALAGHVQHTMPALPPRIAHLGLEGDLPDLPHEVVLHGEPTLVVRPGGTAPPGGQAWTVLVRGKLQEDLLVALARHGIDVRDQVRVRVDRSPGELAERWGGSPYGVLWQGRSTVRHRLGTSTPLPGVFCAGAHVGGGSGIPFVGLGAAQVAEQVGKA